MAVLSNKDLKVAILQELNGRWLPCLKYNLLWSNYPGKRGPLEDRLSVFAEGLTTTLEKVQLKEILP